MMEVRIMAVSTSSQINELFKNKKLDFSNLLTKALEIGINRLWTDAILEEYILGKISRKKVISLVGLDLVKLAEKQDKACQEDISWGLSK